MFFSMTGNSEYYDRLSDEEKQALNIFDLIMSNDKTVGRLNSALDFFIEEHVVFYEPDKCFVVTKSLEDIKNNIIGLISKENYSLVCNLVCQRISIKSNNENISKVKSKKALNILKKIQKGREQQKTKEADKNMELSNIISVVANKHPSLNITNIWDLTVYQLWDAFFRLSNNNIYDIKAMSVAAWGNKDNTFDFTSWFKRIDTDK